MTSERNPDDGAPTSESTQEVLKQFGDQADMSRSERLDWARFSEVVVKDRIAGKHAANNNSLLGYRSKNGHAIETLFKYWAADNLAKAGDVPGAVGLFDDVSKQAESFSKDWLPCDPILLCENGRFEAFVGCDDEEGAMRAGQRLVDYIDDSSVLHLPKVATFAQRAGRASEARDWLTKGIALLGESIAENPFAREDSRAGLKTRLNRDLARLESNLVEFSSPDELMKALVAALSSGDRDELKRLASPTHFSIWLGAHSVLVDTNETLDKLYIAICSGLSGRARMAGVGLSRRLTVGNSRVRKGPLRHSFFTLQYGIKGWYWAGLGVVDTDYWLPNVPEFKKEENQPLAITIRSPWRRGRSFRAGGLRHPIWGPAQWPSGLFSWIPILTKSLITGCGFGLPGYYYNAAVSHNGPDAFSIDFTSYQQGLPFVDRGDGYPVLSPADGVITGVSAGVRSGDDTGANAVELFHGPTRNFPCGRYLSRHLHMHGPGAIAIPVLPLMFATRGTTLGFIDDTGNSAIPHLHFSMHDMELGTHPDREPTFTAGFPGRPFLKPRGTRPTPMDGHNLDDGNEGRCVGSSNA